MEKNVIITDNGYTYSIISIKGWDIMFGFAPPNGVKGKLISSKRKYHLIRIATKDIKKIAEENQNQNRFFHRSYLDLLKDEYVDVIMDKKGFKDM